MAFQHNTTVWGNKCFQKNRWGDTSDSSHNLIFPVFPHLIIRVLQGIRITGPGCKGLKSDIFPSSPFPLFLVEVLVSVVVVSVFHLLPLTGTQNLEHSPFPNSLFTSSDSTVSSSLTLQQVFWDMVFTSVAYKSILRDVPAVSITPRITLALIEHWQMLSMGFFALVWRLGKLLCYWWPAAHFAQYSDYGKEPGPETPFPAMWGK